MQTEVPILDGSALELCALIEEGGVVDQPAGAGRAGHRSPLRGRVRRAGTQGHRHRARRRLRGALHARLSGSRSGDRSSPSVCGSSEAFKREIAPARTFGFVKEIETPRADGPRQRRASEQLHPGRRGGRGERAAPLPRRVRAPQDPRHPRRLLSARTADPRPCRGTHDRALATTSPCFACCASGSGFPARSPSD